MDFLSSQNTKFFEPIKKITEERSSEYESDNIFFPYSNCISLFKPAFFDGECELFYTAE